MDLEVRTSGQTDIVDITDDIVSILPTSVETGVCTISVTHTTAGVIVNEAESRLLDDIEEFLEMLVPESESYRHDEIDNNAIAHLRSILLGQSVTVPVRDGGLYLGTWQRVLLVESDGPRTRTVAIHVTEAISG